MSHPIYTYYSTKKDNVIHHLIYLLLYKVVGENLIISITLLLIIYIIKEIISYYILKAPNIRIVNKLTIPIIIIMYIIFTHLTYNPPYNYLFFDPTIKAYESPLLKIFPMKSIDVTGSLFSKVVYFLNLFFSS